MQFRLNHLTVSLLVALSANAYAQEQPAQDLGTLQVGFFQGPRPETNILTQEDKNKSTAVDLRGLLVAEPAINFGGGNATSQWYTIRGMGQDQIDLKVDNTYSDTQIFHHQGRFMLDPSLVKIVDVQKGTGSASSGIGATSGAIVATTIDAVDLLKPGQNLGFKVGTGYFGNKGHNLTGTVYGRAGDFDAIFSSSYTDFKEYKDGNGNKIAGSGLHQRGLLGKIGWNITPDQRIAISHRQERTWGVRNLREEFDFTFGGRPSRNDLRHRVTENNTTNLEWHGRNMGFIDHVDANIYYMDQKRVDSPVGNADYFAKSKIETTGANIGFNTLFAGKHWLKYGVNYRYQKGKSPVQTRVARATSDQTKTDVGLYTEAIFDFHPVTLTGGLRYDWWRYKGTMGHTQSDGNFNPSVSAIWDVTDDLSFNVGYSMATRSPRLYEVALLGGRMVTPHKNLKAEQSRNFEVGFNYKFDDMFSIFGTYFNQRIKDLQHFPVYESFGRLDRNLWAMTDSGKLKNRGYELGAAFAYGGFHARVGVAYSKPKVHYNDPTLKSGEIDTITTAIQMGRTWTAALSYQWDNPDLEIGWRGRFVEGKNLAGASDRGSGGADRKPGYGVSDVFVTWKPLGNDDWHVNLEVNNIFDKFYRTHSQRMGVNALPQAGRDVRVSMSYRY